MKTWLGGRYVITIGKQLPDIMLLEFVGRRKLIVNLRYKSSSFILSENLQAHAKFLKREPILQRT